MRIGCFRLPSFSAWVVGRAAGDAAGRRPPVVVVQRGRIHACNRRAKRAGLEPGMAADRVETLLPEARVHTRDVALEQAAWEEVLHKLHRLTPFLESLQPGTALFRAAVLPDVRRLACDLEAQAALAPSRAYARLAAVRAAEGHLLDVTPSDVAGFLQHFPVEALSALDFCEDMAEQLQLFGYGTLGAACTLSRRHLDAQFGEEGIRLHALLHPRDEPPVSHFHPPPAILAEYPFEHSVTEPGDLLPVLEHLVEEAAGELGPLQCRRMRVMLQVRGCEEPISTCRLLPELMQSPRRLLYIARTLLLSSLAPGREIEHLVLELSALRRAPYRQPSLFQERPSIRTAVRAVNRRFPGAVVRAVPVRDALFDEEEVRFDTFPDR